ncbi:uncharacterized protein LOC131252683 isoform X2 [Magnolia sinica]|uniref:uncharacterized protein LOC131252683 isoform X2 n=1 Tax=Magnolia sinica TaxID=86752 RepID=UPI002659AC96|nr:uncharacterized protein LOC131252683 isoform X2 [Magnolia sinica]
MPSKIQANDAENSGNIRMGNYAEVKTSSKHQTSKSFKEKTLSPRASRSLKLHDKDGAALRPVDRPYMDRCSGIIENIGERHSALLKSSGNCQKQSLVMKTIEDEEVVKYMSNLPGYLQRSEKADNIQEKALNFGVLDWGRLERWKYDQKRVSGRRNVHSTSSSDTSSPFSTFGSSTQSGQSESGSSSLIQRKQSPSLSSNHLKLSAKEGHSRVSDGKRTKHDAAIHDLKSDPKTDVSVGRDLPGLRAEKGNRKESGSKIVTSNLKSYDTSSACTKGKTKTQQGEFKRREQFQEVAFQVPDEGNPNAYGFLPVDWSGLPQHSDGAASHVQERKPENSLRFESTAFDYEQLTEVNRMSFSEDFHFQFAGLSPGVPHSCPFPCSSQATEWSDSRSGSPFDVPSTKIPSDRRRSFTDSGETPPFGYGTKNVEENESTTKPVNLSVVISYDALSLEAKASKEAVRDPSPTRLSNVGLSRMNRSFSSKEALTRQVNSASSAAKSGSANSSREKGNASSRAKSSPLRRLLDPLLKPKASNGVHFAGLLSVPPAHHAHEAPTSTHGACKPSNAGLNSSTGPLAKRSINFSNWVPADAHGPLQDEKRSPSTMHALLQLACKNGLPLFTFTFNDSDILAATKKKICTGKDDFEWIYTLYSVHEVKKKSGGWMGQGSKDKRHGYVSNVVGQMKVSDSRYPKSTSDGSEDHVKVREFVLLGAELREAAHENLDFLPNSELVAIIIEAPNERDKSFDGDERSDNSRDQSEVGLGDFLPQERYSCYQAENLQTGGKLESQRHSSIVVILPNGVHGLPAKGEPSPLINRWKSGGSCDCGGWDVGCTLTILGDQDRRRKSLSSPEACYLCDDADQVDLFIQVLQASEEC